MSRTYRRRRTNQNGMWTDLDYFTSELVYPWDEFWYTSYVRVPYPKDSAEYKKGKAKFHSDGGTTSFKEPGPSWFRNIFQRKYRRGAAREIQKYMMDEEYEPMIDRKFKLDYWT